MRIAGMIVLASAAGVLWMFGDNVLGQFYCITAVCGGGMAATQS